MGFTECCADFFAALPNPSLSLLPSLVLGLFFSAVFTIFVYKRQTDMPLRDILLDVGSKLFCLIPPPVRHNDHLMACPNPGCVRCRKYKDVEKNIVSRFEGIKKQDGKSISMRIRKSIQSIEEKRQTDLATDNANKVSEQKNKKAPLQKPTLFYMMDLAAHHFWNDFDVYKLEIELMKLNFEVILGEFEDAFKQLQEGNNTGWKLNDIPHGHWAIYPFIDQGVANNGNCRRSPNTAMMLGSFPSVMKDCVFGNACFSILYPDSQIEPHHGPTNLRLRCHLGLRTPTGCLLEVAGEQYKWETGHAVVFDDSYEHSASFVNKPSELQAMPRAILMIDFWHPDISEDEKNVLLELLQP